MGIGGVALGTGDFQVKAPLPGGIDVGMTHVVAVAHESNRAAADAAAGLLECLDVGQQLAGVKPGGHRIDDGHAGCGGELLEHGLLRRADYDDVYHFGQDPCRVCDRFPAPELTVIRSQYDGMAAELAHAGIEGDARSS